MRTLIFSLLPVLALGQFAPQVGQAGSTAIYKDSNVFVNWAKTCTAVVGLKDIARPSLGKAGVGTEQNGVGKAGTNATFTLGDAGTAILTFELPITNKPGPDLAVFENAFGEEGTGLDYMEFAFVEASSDGVNYFRFPAEYIGSTTTQLGPFEPTLATNYHNLAGKYWGGYGTPFDLEDLKDISLLDIEKVTHIKIVDVIGTLNNTYASLDSKGRKINDPYPTDFAAGGFDLDAVGVIHQADPLGMEFASSRISSRIYPNPSAGTVFIKGAESTISRINLTDITGNTIQQWQTVTSQGLDISEIRTGVYLLTIENEGGKFTEKLIIN